MLTGFVPANKEIWVFGDKQMTFIAQHLDYWKEQARKDPHEALYILHRFDVKAFPSHSTSSNSVEVILSSLIGALNTRPKLPDLMVIMLGDTKFWCDNQTLKFTMDTVLKTLVKELKRIIEIRQRDLPVKALGSDPRIFFVKLNWKPEKSLDSVPQYPMRRRTFNKLLDAIVRPRGANTILLHEINEKIDPDFFLGHGDLSPKGYRQLWASLSEAIQDFMSLGHQQRKVFTTKEKQGRSGEVDSSLHTSDDDSITNRNVSTTWTLNRKIQNKRRYTNFTKSRNRDFFNNKGGYFY